MTPLLITIFCVLAIIAGATITTDSKEYKRLEFGEHMTFISAVIGLVSLLGTFSYAETYKLYPVEYTAVKSKTRVVVVTNYGMFDSNKIRDLTNWIENKPGFIKVKYNVFGCECQKYEFTTEKE